MPIETLPAIAKSSNGFSQCFFPLAETFSAHSPDENQYSPPAAVLLETEMEEIPDLASLDSQVDGTHHWIFTDA
jgi:hypothetical protein